MSAEDSARDGWPWMALLICLVVGRMVVRGLSWNDLSSSRLAWVPSHVAFGFQIPTREGKPQGICTRQPSASVKFALVLLAKASHMIKTRVNVDGTIQICGYREICNIVGFYSNNLPDQASMRILFSQWAFFFCVLLKNHPNIILHNLSLDSGHFCLFTQGSLVTGLYVAHGDFI